MTKKRLPKIKKRKNFLPISEPCIGKEEREQVLDTLRSGWLTSGPKVQRFENEFKKHIGCNHAVALNSCTAALHLALICSGVKKGDEVILSPLTFVSQANVILHAGAKPVFVDIDPQTLNIDPEKIKKSITKKTKAIIITHFAGQPCDREKIIPLAMKKKIKIIEDAAHALGAKYKGKMIGADPRTVSCFSFYPIKNMTTAEGGMLTTGSKKIADRARLLSLHGLSKGAWKRYSKKASWKYDVIEPGYKYNLPDILAAIGLAQIKKLRVFNRKRQKVAEAYIKGLKDLNKLRIPDVKENITHAWQIFPIILKSPALRERMINELKKMNIGTSVHFQPVHLFKAYRGLTKRRPSLEVSESISKRILSLPISPLMNLKNSRFVVLALKQLLEN